ncbi:DEAD/DEAH box helicase family protein, partial [Gammaproteobacteria bacterium]|nr:DEAD/DEAH box helicase family protein [Gammaproteobacteria bacterium]
MKTDSLIRKAPSWSELFTVLQSFPAKEKGDVFERVVQLYLRTHPEYESRLTNVWLLDEVPKSVREKLNLPDVDEGIDLIGETTDRKYWAIQAKFRGDPNSRLTNKGDLATFTALAFHTCKNIDYGLICATTSQAIKKIDLLGDNVGFRLFSDFEELDDHNFAGWKRIKSALGKTARPPKRLNPKPHQRRAIKNAYNHYITDKQSRGKMIMPCGTGKSLTGFWIAQKLKAKRVVVAVPSLALVKQTLNVWTREYLAHGIKPEWICVCSDAGSGEVDADAFTAHTYDLGVPCTTDIDDIATFLRKRPSTPQIVFTTYHSGRVLAEAATKAKRVFELGIMDEAHKTVGRKDKVFAHLLDDNNIKIKKRLFMTATERVFIGSSDEIVSMDDLDVYGDTFELLTFKDAIEAKDPIICDYKFVTIEIPEREIRELWEDNKYLRLDAEELDEVATRSLAAGLALRKAYTKFKAKRAISFHSSIKKAENFKRQQEAITQVFPDLAKVECHHVSSKIPTGKRTTILRDFASSKKGLITNARCLTEGIDIPTVDCVLFADPRRSTIDIVQAAGRAMRKAPGKEYGYIIVPMVVPDNADPDEFAGSTEFKEIVRTIRPLAINDSRIVDYFRSVSNGDSPSPSSPVMFDTVVRKSVEIDEESLKESIRLKIWEKLAKINWQPFKEARAYARSLNISSGSEWNEYAKSGQIPIDIPRNPSTAYQKLGWISWGDWLGTGYIADQHKIYMPFPEARRYVRSLKLQSGKEWRQFAQSDACPKDIPYKPERTYLEKGWSGMGDWLGTGTIAPKERTFLKFTEAREYARSLNLRNNPQWRKYCKECGLPKNIPQSPDQKYRDKGWKDWGDWLGTGNVHRGKIKFLPFEQARAYARSLKLSSTSEWMEYIQNTPLPDNIPANPALVYKKQGWKGIPDWLGTDNIATSKRVFLEFSEARRFVHSLKLKDMAEWKDYTQSGQLPKSIPTNPHRTYKDKGWTGYGDWLGTGSVASFNRTYLP